MSLLSKICYALGFLGTGGSIILAIVTKKDFSWQFISLIWMFAALMADMRATKLEGKLNGNK